MSKWYFGGIEARVMADLRVATEHDGEPRQSPNGPGETRVTRSRRVPRHVLRAGARILRRLSSTSAAGVLLCRLSALVPRRYLTEIRPAAARALQSRQPVVRARIDSPVHPAADREVFLARTRGRSSIRDVPVGDEQGAGAGWRQQAAVIEHGQQENRKVSDVSEFRVDAHSPRVKGSC